MRLYVFPVFCALALVLCAPAFAQLDTGVIVGRVTDPSGAVVPGAKILVVATETNFEYPTVTTSDGDYRVPALHPGLYRVTVEAAGFKKLVRDGLILRMSENLQVDGKLEVGAVAESVEVTGAAPLLDTQTSSAGQVMEGSMFYDLPMQQRWLRSSLFLVPGFSTSGTGVWPGSFGGWLVLGQGGIGLYEDGGVAFRQNNADAAATIANSIEELKVLTAVLPAEYGHIVAGAITVVKKSGTNTIHGIANGAIYTRSMIERQFLQLKTSSQQGIHTYQAMPDFNVTGPVYIPHIYNGKNKTFFSVSGQWMFGTTTAGAGANFTVPTANELAGDYSAAAFYANGMPTTITPNTIYDPATLTSTVVNGVTNWSRTPLPGNIVPTNRFSNLAKALLGMNPFVKPNWPANWSTTGPSNNIYGTVPQWILYDTYSYRFDQQISQNMKFFTSATIGRNTPSGIAHTSATLVPAVSQYYSTVSTTRNWNSDVQAALIWSISPTLISETRGTLYRYTSNPQSPTPFMITDLMRSAGIPNISADTYIGALSVGGSTFGQAAPSVSVQNTYGFREDVTKVWRNHAFKMGYEYLYNNQISHGFGNLTASLNSYTGTAGILSNGTTTISNTGGFSLAEFQLGYVSGGSYSLSTGSWLPIIANHNGYFQDDWKIAPTLTLNLGLRYVTESPLRTKWNQMSAWEPYVHEVDAAGTALYTPPSPWTWTCPSTGCSGGYLHNVSSFYKRDNNNFQPRVGFAWHPLEKYVLRGGFAINTKDNNFDQIPGNRNEMDKSFSYTIPTGSPNGYYLFNINQGPLAWAFPAQRADGSTPRSGNLLGNGSVTWTNPNIKNAYAETWSLQIQRSIANDYQLQLSYDGSAWVHSALANIAINSDPYALIPNPNTNGVGYLNLADPANYAYLTSSSFTGNTAYFRPWVNWGNVSYKTNNGRTTFHSGTFKIEKRYSHGITVLSFVTWSKNLGWGGSQNMYMDPAQTKGIQGGDMPWRNVNNLVWELPFGKGRHFFNRTGWVDRIIGRWELTWLYSVNTGPPGGVGFTGPTRLDYPSYMPTTTGYFRIKNPHLRDGWQDIGGDRFTYNNQNSFFGDVCGALTVNWGNGCVVAAPNYTRGSMSTNVWYSQRIIAASGTLTKDWMLHEQLRLHARLFMQNPFKWYNLNSPSASLNSTSVANSLGFGKVTGEQGTSTLGGQPVITLELALRW